VGHATAAPSNADDATKVANTMIAATATAVAPAATGQEKYLTPGSIFHGDYRISQDKFKVGGMGEVYRAVNIINESVTAIKLIRSDLSHDPDIIERFMQEDKALRCLTDPAVVRYYGVRRDPASDRLYIQMEYVDGPTLGEYVVAHGAVSADSAKAVCRRLARGLMDAHAQGVVHRDISPDNILLPNGDLTQAKLIDFGIAKVAVSGEFTVYRTNFVGKFRYASPEHFSQTAPIDQKSDIYSLGLVIAAAAAGIPLPMGRDELSGAKSRLQVPDLATVPAELRPLLARMLDPDPARRPTAADLVASLSAGTAGLRRPGGGSGLWIGLGAAAVIALASAGAWVWLAHPFDNRAAESVVIRPSDPAGGHNASSGSGSAASASPNSSGSTTTALNVPPNPPRPKAAFAVVQQSIAGLPGACTQPELSQPVGDRIQISGLVGSPAYVDRAKATLDPLGYTLEDRLVASSPACQTLQLLGQYGKLNATTGPNRPTISASRSPALFKVGEKLDINAVVPLTGEFHLYKIVLDGTGTAIVDHRPSRSFVDLSTHDTVKGAGWDLIVVIVSPKELEALSALRTASLEDVVTALGADLGKTPNRHDLVSGALLIQRAAASDPQ
jgi:serine/threonine protein kinase